MNRQNAVMAEACISSMWRRGSLVLFTVYTVISIIWTLWNML